MAGWSDIVAGFVSGLGDTAVKIRTAITGIDATKQAELAALAANLEAQAKKAETDLLAAQIDVNKIEASNANIFISGWRPFIGWTCGAIFAYNYILRPILLIIPGIPALPLMDMGEISPVLMGMLGLAAARTVEKINRAAGRH